MEATAMEGGAEVGGDVKELPQQDAPPKGDEQPNTLPKAAEKKTPSERRKYKLKVNGKDEEWEGSDDDVVRELQMSRASQERFEQAKRLYQKAQPVMTAKEKGDLNTLLDGLPDDKKREWAEQYLSEWLQYQEMSPEQREALENKKKLDHYEKEKAQREQEEKERSEKARREQYAKQAHDAIQQELEDVLKDIPQDKRNPRLVARIADEMLSHFQSRKARLPAKQAYERARENLRTDVKDLLGGMDDDMLIEYLPKETVNKILKYHTNKVRNQSPFGNRSASEPKRPKGNPNRMATDDYFNKLDEKYGS